MTLQQMEYIVAVDKYRQFVKAAESCNVTQSTLSAMILKLEEELDVQIFDRKAHPLVPTPVGEKVISQAKIVLSNAEHLKEMIMSEQQQESGELSLGVIPTVSPYIIPGLFRMLRSKYPNVTLRASESMTSTLIRKLMSAEIDVALMSTPLEHEDLLEIPLYYEKFLAYISPNEEAILAKPEICIDDIPTERLWVLQDGHCLRNQVMNICKHNSGYASMYEAGSIDTLVRIVDINGGYTIIPELHVALLSDSQKKRVRRIVSPEPVREISLVIRQDYIRERMLNILSECIQSIIPAPMIDSRLKKFAIKL
jgi:hypothetical protein